MIITPLLSQVHHFSIKRRGHSNEQFGTTQINIDENCQNLEGLQNCSFKSVVRYHIAEVYSEVKYFHTLSDNTVFAGFSNLLLYVL